MAESALLKAGTSETPGAHLGSPSVNQPDIDARTLRAGIRAISSVEQIYALCEAAFNPKSDRNVKNGIIADQYNDSPPYPQGYLEGKQQKYRHNSSTGFMSGILDQAIASPNDLIDSALYLTSASLDPEDDPDGTKADAYRRKFTKLVRSWPKWDSHNSNRSQEVVVYGYCAVACDDPDEWRPEVCRQGQFGVPDETGQHASEAQFFMRKKSFTIDKLLNKLTEFDRETVETGGWNIDACVDALNEAMPKDRNTDASSQGTTTRTFAELVRDGNAGAAYDPQARTVDCYILLATEADGKVSRYIVTQIGRRQLFEHEDAFEKIEDVIVFYTLNPGTGTLYSSKGGGRKLINLSKSVERTRNKAMDNTYQAGLVWLHSPKGMVSVQMKVFDAFAVIGSEATVSEKAMPDRSEAFDRADERATRYAEQSFGQYIPQKPSQTDPHKEKTATEITTEARRDEISRSQWLKRHFKQFGHEMTLIAKKAGDPDTSDTEAKAWQEDMAEKDGITPELLKKLVNQPQGVIVQDMTQELTGKMVQALPMIRQSPNWDQNGVEKEVSTRVLGKEFVDRYYRPAGTDPQEEAKAMQTQDLENVSMVNGGNPVPAPGDYHRGHLKYLVAHLDRDEPQIEQQAQGGQIDQAPQVLDNWATAIKHGDGHVHYWEQQAGANKNQEELTEAGKFKGRLAQSQEKHDAILKGVVERAQQRQKQQQQQPQQQPAAAPQQQSPNGSQPEAKGEREWGGLTEKIVTALIAQWTDLRPEIRTQLEERLGFTPETKSTATPPQEKTPSLTASASNRRQRAPKAQKV